MNIWFIKLIRQFFFNIDKIIFNFIPTIYNLLIDISRTSVLSQADLASISNRIYQLLAVFMVFKVTFSLIMYVVNPDDFSDKSKGISKLGTNIVISLALLVLTPYLFSYAYQLQSIILEDNSLGTLIFGDNEDGSTNTFKFSSAGEQISYTTLAPFFIPNTTIDSLRDCSTLMIDGEFNKQCSGIDLDGDDLYIDGSDNSLAGLAKNSESKANYSEEDVANYVSGVENETIGLMFRQNFVLATADISSNGKTNTEFIMDYKFIFSTAVGVIVIVLLISFCMDVALRSVKLSFLQLIAPIPILSYIDPKSGKDGLFKKWYQQCFSTYISIFVRLLALYFGVFIISKINKLSDIINGSYQSNMFVKIFVIVGALMFAKQLPKILQGLGIKLDGDGKFILNPLKRFEEQALGGKQILGGAKGFAAGAAVGAAGTITGAGAARFPLGALGGLKDGIKGKKMGEIRKNTATRNAEMRRAIASGSTFGERMGARFSSFMGTPGTYGRLEHDKIDLQNRIDNLNADKQKLQHEIAPQTKKIEQHKRLQDSISSMEKRAQSEIEDGHSKYGRVYLNVKNKANEVSDALSSGKTINDINGGFQLFERDKDGKIRVDANGNAMRLRKNTIQETDVNGKYLFNEDGTARVRELDGNSKIDTNLVTQLQMDANDYKGDYATKAYMTDTINGEIDDKTFMNTYENQYLSNAEELEMDAETDGSKIHGQFGASKGEVGKIEGEIYKTRRQIETIDSKQEEYNAQMQQINAAERDAKASLEAVHAQSGGPSSPDTITQATHTVGYRSGGYGTGESPALSGYGGMPPRGGRPPGGNPPGGNPPSN